MKIIFQRPDEQIYLLELDLSVNGIPQGMIVNLDRGQIFPRQGVESLLRRGPWEDYTGSETAQSLISRVGEVVAARSRR